MLCCPESPGSHRVRHRDRPHLRSPSLVRCSHLWGSVSALPNPARAWSAARGICGSFWRTCPLLGCDGEGLWQLSGRGYLAERVFLCATHSWLIQHFQEWVGHQNCCIALPRGTGRVRGEAGLLPEQFGAAKIPHGLGKRRSKLLLLTMVPAPLVLAAWMDFGW